MKHLLPKALLSLALLSALACDSRAAGNDAPPPTVFSHPYIGVELQVPNGWEAQMGPSGFLLSHQSLGGFVAIIPHDHNTLDEVRQAARTGLREEPGVILAAQGELAAWSTNGLAGPFLGTAEGNSVRAYGVFLLSPHGGGATVLAAAMAEDKESDAKRAAEILAAAIRFMPRLHVSPLAPWEQRFTNCRLIHFPSGPSPVDAPDSRPRVVLDLCADRSFTLWLAGPDQLPAWTDRATWPASATPGSATFQGTWSLREAAGHVVLRLDYGPSSARQFTLSFPDGSTYLNELHVFRSYSDALRAEDIPSCP